MKTKITITLLALLLAACGSEGTGSSSSTTGGTLETQCSTVATWCPDGHLYAWPQDDPDATCYCACTDQGTCADSPEKSHCGVLLRAKEDPSPTENPYEAFFPEGGPYVCRTSETTIP